MYPSIFQFLILKGAVPPLSIIRTLLWFFSLTFQHLPSKPFAHTELNTEFGLTVKVYSRIILHTPAHDTPKHFLESPARLAQIYIVIPTKGFKTSSLIRHALASFWCHQCYIGQSLYQTMMVLLICQNPVPEMNAPYSGCPTHRHYFHLYKEWCPGMRSRDIGVGSESSQII